MSAHNKVVWSEGLFLQPQHFQQQDRYLRALRRGALPGARFPTAGASPSSRSSATCCGIGKFGLRRAAGVFPDGTPFRMPDDDPLPEPIDIGAQTRDQIVYLAVPLRRADARRRPRRGRRRAGTPRGRASGKRATRRRRPAIRRCSKSARLRTRFLLRERGDARPTRASRSRISSSAAPTSRWCSTKRSSRRCCDARAATRLATFMTELLGLLHQRGEALGGRVAATGRGGSAEIADFLMLQAINRYEPLLAHLRRVGRRCIPRSCSGCACRRRRAGDVHHPSKRAPAAAGLPPRSPARVVRAGDGGAARVAERRARAARDSDSDRAKKFGISVATVADRGAVRHRGVHPGRARGSAGRGAAPAFPGAVEDRAGGEDSRPRQPAAAGRAGAPDAGGAAADPVHAGFVYFELDQSHELWSQLKRRRRRVARRRRFPRLGAGVLGHLAADKSGSRVRCRTSTIRSSRQTPRCCGRGPAPAGAAPADAGDRRSGRAVTRASRGARRPDCPTRRTSSSAPDSIRWCRRRARCCCSPGSCAARLSAPDVGGLRRHALDEIRRFEERARAAGVANEVVLAARYALCAALDEAVLSTPWGAQSEWAQQTLLVALHREAWGGEKFFEMLDRISQDPERHIDLMELQYLCLALGFAGKYQVMPTAGSAARRSSAGAVSQDPRHRGTPRPELSLRWQGVEDRRNPLIRYVPWWVVGAAALAILADRVRCLLRRLGSAAAPVHAALAQDRASKTSRSRAGRSAAGPTLKQLLAPEEQSGSVQRRRGRRPDARSRCSAQQPVRLGQRDAVNPAYEQTAATRSRRALDQVPGRVLVVGHTDDQPIQSLRYRDNFELSRERAVSVATMLQQALTQSGADRVERRRLVAAARTGPSRRRTNRARNRRVEIVHVRG